MKGIARFQNDACYAVGVCVFLLLAIGLIYGQALGYGLLGFDDSLFVADNPHVAPGLTGEGIRWAFVDGPAGEWYPLSMVSHMLDCQLFGLHGWGHHLTNVLLHAAASIALFLVWRRYTGEFWPSALVAAIFAVHPQHVESVAWVAERKDVLSGLFFMLTLGAYLGYVRRGRSAARYLLVVVLFALGLLAKPMLVTVPALLLLLDFWPLARFGAASDAPAWTGSVERPGAVRLVLEKLPLAALALGDGLITLRTHAHNEMISAWQDRFGNAAVSGVNYLAGFFYPIDLAAFYPFPQGGPTIWKVAGAGVILALVSAAAVVWRRRCPYLFVGWFWYLGMLTPVLGLFKIGWISMADRYMYLPGIGLYVALAWGAWRLGAGSREGRWVLGTCAGLAIVVLTACAAWQTSYWRNDVTLWTHTVACTSENGKGEFFLANALAEQGQYDQAAVYYERARHRPTDPGLYNSWGKALAMQGKFDQAIPVFRKAVEIEPNAFQPHLNLGLVLLERKQLDESRIHLLRALEIDPRCFRAYCGLAQVSLREKKLDQAIAEFEQALAIEPGSPAAHYDLAQTFVIARKYEQSIPHFEAVLDASPRYVEPRIFLARALAALGQSDKAAAEYRRALEIEPDNSVARQDLAELLRKDAGQPSP